MKVLNKFLKRINQLVAIFLFSGAVYVMIELLYRGFSDWSMFVLAGFLGIVISLVNNNIIMSYDSEFCVQVLFCTLCCIAGEYLVGITLNSDFHIWDYRNLPFTFGDGQLNLFFCGAWMLICTISIPLLDYIEWRFFGEEKPYYKILGKIVRPY